MPLKIEMSKLPHPFILYIVIAIFIVCLFDFLSLYGETFCTYHTALHALYTQ